MKTSRSVTIGVDFDNTLVSYDALIYKVAVERGLVDVQTAPIKKCVRDSIWKLPGGDIEWQKMQALVYGPRIHEAIPAPGSIRFFYECGRNDSKLKIVSHKTEFANYDQTGTNLRTAALAWLTQHGFLGIMESSITHDDVYFESTRVEKIKRIKDLGCDYFIDDLEETFLEESFPAGVEKLLYSVNVPGFVPSGVRIAGDWETIIEHIFDRES